MTYNEIYLKLCEIHSLYDGADIRSINEEEDIELEDEFNTFLRVLRISGDIVDFSVKNIHNFNAGAVSVAAITKMGKLIHDVFEWERS